LPNGGGGSRQLERRAAGRLDGVSEMIKRTGLAALSLLALTGHGLAAEPPAHDCDRLAAHPADPNKVGPGVQWDIMNARAAIKACEKAVKRYPNAVRFQFQLGRALLRAQRRDQGLPYLFAAAEQNYVVAFANIGGTYQFDLGNYAEAIKWYRRGAELGDTSSQNHLADIYFLGHGVEQNFAEAAKWFMKSVEKGSAFAEYKMGQIYRIGDNTIRPDPIKAIQWFNRAAAKGFARAQNDLGSMYERGEGVTPDVKRAADWYGRAANQGWAVAQLNVARLYERGDGVERDSTEAFYWYRLATDARGQRTKRVARQGVQRTRKRVGQTQIAAIDARINRWTRQTPEQSVTAASVVDVAYVPPQEVDPGYAPPPGASQAPAVDLAYAPPPSAPAVDLGYTPPPAAEAKSTIDPAYTPPPAAPTPAQPSSARPVGADVEPTFASYVAVKRANVRRGPDANAEQVGRLGEGQPLTVLGKVAGRDWMMVMLEDQTVGYVYSPLIEPAASPTVVAAAQPRSIDTPDPATATARDETTIALATPAAPPARPDFAGIDFGRYHALVIGNDQYEVLPKLQTAVADARAVADTLQKDYGFEAKVLLNATRADIVTALDQYRKRLTANDNLLVYYAGHGIVDEGADRGYWLPVDATEDTTVSWVSNATITDTLKALKAKQVLVVADSCYSGTLTRGVKAMVDNSAEYLGRIATTRARVAMTSGGFEPVADGGGGGHSVFARAFLDALEAANDKVNSGTEMFLSMRRQVMLGAEQTPEYGDIRLAGHQGGDFLFVWRDRARSKANN
jgi:TPR repeat protein